MTKYKRFEGESDEELIYRVTGDKDKIGSWQGVADILNELLGTEYTESKFRKQRQAFDKMFNANQAKFSSDKAVLDDIMEQRRELEHAKIQFRDDGNFSASIKDSSDNSINYEGNWATIDNVLIFNIVGENENYGRNTEWDIRGAMLSLTWTANNGTRILTLYHTAR